jgi:hypothetical protein
VIDSIKIEIDGSVHELNAEIVEGMVRCLIAIGEQELSELDYLVCLESSLMEDVKLLLDEVEDSLVEEW